MTRYALALAVLAAPALAQTNRYWVEPIVDAWDDASNWSLTPSGPAGGGLPISGDDAYFTTRSICFYTGPGVSPAPVFDGVILQGTGSGTTQLLMSAGTLETGALSVGHNGPRNEVHISGGTLTAALLSVGLNGGEGTFTALSAAQVNAFNVKVGAGDATGTLDIEGGDFDFHRIDVSTTNFVGSGTGVGALNITGGRAQGSSIYLGIDGPATLDQSAGDLEVSVILAIGYDPAPSVHTQSDDAVLDVYGQLSIGNGIDGHGIFRHTGGFSNINELVIGKGENTTGALEFTGGVMGANTACVGAEGEASVTLDGGGFYPDTLTIGESVVAAPRPQRVTVRAGTLGAGTIAVGLGSGTQAHLDAFGGTINAQHIAVGADSGATGTLSATAPSGAAINADRVTIGELGNGTLSLDLGATIDTPLLEIGGSPTHSANAFIYGGTLRADTIDVRPDDSTDDQLTIQNGLIITSDLNIAPNASVLIAGDPGLDARISDITNGGDLTFNGIFGVLSGPFLGPPFNTRLLGTITNNGTFRSRTTISTEALAMSLVNNAQTDVLTDDVCVVMGFVTNTPTGTISVSRTSPIASGILDVRSTAGLMNQGLIELDDGQLAAPNGAVTNDGTIAGFGEIHAPVVNNAQINPSISEPAETLHITGGLTCAPSSILRFVVTTSGNTTIALPAGDVALDGAINIAFASDVPLPAHQTEYELIRCDAGTITGAPASTAVLGYPCEIVVEPTRVIARSLRCSPADVVAPYGALNLDDVDAFVAGFLAGGLIADCDANTNLNLDDIDCFVAAFLAGCS